MFIMQKCEYTDYYVRKLLQKDGHLVEISLIMRWIHGIGNIVRIYVAKSFIALGCCHEIDCNTVRMKISFQESLITCRPAPKYWNACFVVTGIKWELSFD